MRKNTLDQWAKIIAQSRHVISKNCEKEFKTQLRLLFTDCEQQGLSFEQQIQIISAYARDKRPTFELTLSDDERNVR